MYIAPTSIVKILRNIPLDNTYKDTLYFANEGAQSTYFLTQMKVQVRLVRACGSKLTQVRLF